MIFLRILAIIIGALLIYASIFLYEDEDGKIQNLLEDWWVKISDAKKFALSKHTAFMRVIADLMTLGFNRFFGESFFSLQSVGVSACYAMALLNLTIFIIPLIYSKQSNDATYDFLSGFLLSLSLGTIPVFIKSSFWMKSWFILFVFITFNNFIIPMLDIVLLARSKRHDDAALIVMIITISIVLGVTLFTLFIAIIRKSFQKVSGATSSIKISIIYLLNCMPFFVLYGLFKLTLFVLPSLKLSPETNRVIMFGDFNSSMASFLLLLTICVWFINGVFVITATIFVGLSVLMILHNLFWPALDRPIYSLQKLGIAKRSKLLGTLGALLIMTALGGATWLEKIVEILNPY
jgi:hypothetical protein